MCIHTRWRALLLTVDAADFTNSLHLNFPRAYAAYNNRAWCKEAKGDRKAAIADYQGTLPTFILCKVY
jgi:hypothetical protein